VHEYAATVVVPNDSTWPKHCGRPMWFNGKRVEFYCECGHKRAPESYEVREVAARG
jgi:hypothetical protein